MLPELAPGRFIHPPGTATNSTALAMVADTLHLYPFRVTESVVVDRIGLVVSTAAATGSFVMEAGLYMNNGAGASRRLISASIAALNSLGVKGTDIEPFALGAGDYWIAYRCPTHTTMPVLRGANFLPEMDTSAGAVGPVPSPIIYTLAGQASLPVNLNGATFGFTAGIPASIGFRTYDPAPKSLAKVVTVPASPLRGVVGLARTSAERFGILPTNTL